VRIPNLLATVLHTLLDVGELRIVPGVPREIAQTMTGWEPIPGLLNHLGIHRTAPETAPGAAARWRLPNHLGIHRTAPETAPGASLPRFRRAKGPNTAGRKW
jgi:hypothetical protein